MPTPNLKTLSLTGGLFLRSLYSADQDGGRDFYASFVKAGPIKGKGSHDPKITITHLALEKAFLEDKFNNCAVFIDHAGFFEYPSLDNLAGVTRESHWNQVTESIEGIIHLYKTTAGLAAATLIDELLANPGQSPDVGLSLVCYPVWDHAEEISKLTAITHVESVDLVFEPAAEGRIIAALSAHRMGNPPVVAPRRTGNAPVLAPSAMAAPVLAHHRTGNAPVLAQGDPMPTPIEDPTAEPVSTTQPPPDPTAQAEPWLAAIQQSTISAMITSSGLPEASCQRLSERSFTSPDEIATAIEEERSYLARLRENNVITLSSTPPRGDQISGMKTSLDRLSLAFEALLAGTQPADGIQPLSGVREFYHLLSGDYEMTGMFKPDRLYLANVNSSTMANLVANVLNKRVINEFQQYPRWWESIANQEDFQSLQQIKWISLGGIGELPTVAEGAAYTELTWDDNAETADFVKKGGYLGITLETIDKDDTSRVRAAPKALAQAAWLTLSKAISAIFTSNSGVGPDMSDGDALFHTNHSNLGTTALTLAEWNVVKLAMRKQTELHSGERLGGLVVPKFLIVPPDLEATALKILASEYEYTYALSNGVAAPINPNAEGDSFSARLANARSNVVVVDLWTDTNNWAACANPQLYPTLGIAFRYGRTPEIFSVASPTAGLMFTNDTLPIKVRFFYATGPMDYRGLYKENVS